MNIVKYLAIVVLLLSGISSTAQTEIFRDPRQPLDARVNDLIGKITLEEKIHQMMHRSPAISRLNIPAYNWWNEGLHGVARSGVATIFPQAIGLGATFDEELVQQVASVVSDEARAMYNAAIKKQYYQQYGGLTFWTPNINIFRDPRWGRGQETYGEDPYLTSRLGVAFVKGLQGNDQTYLKVGACAKHFAVHSGPEKLRHQFNAVASPKDLRETYLPAFEALVKEGGVESVMCAYNSTNGEPCCSNNYLLTEVLRKEWNFKGHVVSDCWAIVDLYHNGHNVVKTQAEAAALAVKSGVSLNCGDEYPALLEAVKQNLITENEIDRELTILLKTRFRLGMFDPAGSNPYDTLSDKIINSPSNRTLALRTAEKSIVLLKNNGALPLRNDLSNYFITGPNASSIDAMLGNYYGVNPSVVTVLEGIAAKIQPGSQLQYRPGILPDRDNANGIDWTTPAARKSNATFVVMGITGMMEGEEGESIASPYFGDRLDYNLPRNQIDFLKKICDGNENPVIAIVTGGSPMNLSEVHELADAVLLVWYPGEEGGSAVANIIFGNTSPSGRLPITFPKSLEQLPPYEDYGMKGRTYRYMESEPMYPFGFGLSYATFTYGNVTLGSPLLKKKQATRVSVVVTNTGKVEGEEVVQLYVTAVTHKQSNVPLHTLCGIKRVGLKPGESKTIQFEITPRMLELVNSKGERVADSGTFRISVGGSLPIRRSEELGVAKSAQVILTVK